MNLPNKLTFLRILLLPVIVLLYLIEIKWPTINLLSNAISLKQIILVSIFLIASFTDFLDGYLARSRNLITTFGKFADPIADKLLVNTLFFLLAVDGLVHPIVFIIMLWRDTVVDGIRMLASSEGTVIAAGIYGKMKTVLQMFAIVLVLLDAPFAQIVVWVAAAMSLFSGVQYFYNARHIIFKSV